MATEKLTAYRESQYERKAQSLRMVGWSKPVAEIIAHLRLLDEVGDEVGYYLRPEQAPFDASREQLVTIAQAKLKANKRTAGVRALKSKYGKEAAERIIEKHTGHRYNLR